MKMLTFAFIFRDLSLCGELYSSELLDIGNASEACLKMFMPERGVAGVELHG